MGEIKRRPPVKLIIGFIYKDEAKFEEVLKILEIEYGKVDYISEIIDFDHTAYYVKEMGGPLLRRFISFSDLISPEFLPDIKINTNDIEERFCDDLSVRSINIDPGYLSAAKLILATTKNQRQRVYLDKGIFAEPELYFKGKGFTYWEWSYPDYRTREYLDIFNQIRKVYALQIEKQGLRLL